MDNKENNTCSFCKSPKMIAMCFLMMLVMFGLFYFLFFKNASFKLEKTGSGRQAGYAANIPAAKNSSKVIVYYFYTSKRCASCHKIESYTKEAVQSIKNNKLELRMVNVDESANDHFIKDYGLFTKSVVISSVKNGKQEKWKNLDKIWTLLGDKEKFENYITKEIKSYL